MNETSEPKDFVWLMNIIVSCNNEFQFECVDRLIELYQIKNKDGLYPKLIEQREKQWNKIIENK